MQGTEQAVPDHRVEPIVVVTGPVMLAVIRGFIQPVANPAPGDEPRHDLEAQVAVDVKDQQQGARDKDRGDVQWHDHDEHNEYRDFQNRFQGVERDGCEGAWIDRQVVGPVNAVVEGREVHDPVHVVEVPVVDQAHDRNLQTKPGPTILTRIRIELGQAAAVHGKDDPDNHREDQHGQQGVSDFAGHLCAGEGNILQPAPGRQAAHDHGNEETGARDHKVSGQD